MTSRNEQTRKRLYCNSARFQLDADHPDMYTTRYLPCIEHPSCNIDFQQSFHVAESVWCTLTRDAPPAMPLPYLANQTFVSTFRALASVSNRQSPSNLLGCNYMCEHSRVSSREPRDRYSSQPADPEHTGWLVRTSPPGHRLPGLRRRRVRWFPKFRLKC